MASRFNSAKESRGNPPGTGLSMCAAIDNTLRLQALAEQSAMTRQDRLDMRETPVRIDGSDYLGWAHMPPHVQAKFLAGEVAFVIIDRRTS